MADTPTTNMYESVLQSASFAVIAHDPDLRITDWNAGAARLFGYSRDEAISRSIADLLLGGNAEAWRQAPTASSDRPAVLRCTRKDGGVIPCEWRYEPLRDDQGASVGALCFGSDATARVAAETKQRTVEQLLQGTIDSLPVAIFVCDRQGTFTFHDGRGAEMAGLKRGQIIGMNIFEMYKGSPSLEHVRQAFAGEIMHSAVDGHGIFWETWHIPLRDERGEIDRLLGITLDVTASKNIELELRSKLELIERQQKVIRELETPIIEVWSRVLTLPMVGVVDSARTAEVMDGLLRAVVRTSARYAILDLTGVESVDSNTAANLFNLVRAVRLLGAEGIITGIRPTVAQTIVQLGLDLSSVTTLGNLRAGLHHCMTQMSGEDGAAALPASTQRPRLK